MIESIKQALGILTKNTASIGKRKNAVTNIVVVNEASSISRAISPNNNAKAQKSKLSNALGKATALPTALLGDQQDEIRQRHAHRRLMRSVHDFADQLERSTNLLAKLEGFLGNNKGKAVAVSGGGGGGGGLLGLLGNFLPGLLGGGLFKGMGGLLGRGALQIAARIPAVGAVLASAAAGYFGWQQFDKRVLGGLTTDGRWGDKAHQLKEAVVNKFSGKGKINEIKKKRIEPIENALNQNGSDNSIRLDYRQKARLYANQISPHLFTQVQLEKMQESNFDVVKHLQDTSSLGDAPLVDNVEAGVNNAILEGWKKKGFKTYAEGVNSDPNFSDGAIHKSLRLAREADEQRAQKASAKVDTSIPEEKNTDKLSSGSPDNSSTATAAPTEPEKQTQGVMSDSSGNSSTPSSNSSTTTATPATPEEQAQALSEASATSQALAMRQTIDEMENKSAKLSKDVKKGAETSTDIDNGLKPIAEMQNKLTGAGSVNAGASAELVVAGYMTEKITGVLEDAYGVVKTRDENAKKLTEASAHLSADVMPYMMREMGKTIEKAKKAEEKKAEEEKSWWDKFKEGISESGIGQAASGVVEGAKSIWRRLTGGGNAEATVETPAAPSGEAVAAPATPATPAAPAPATSSAPSNATGGGVTNPIRGAVGKYSVSDIKMKSTKAAGGAWSDKVLMQKLNADNGRIANAILAAAAEYNINPAVMLAKAASESGFDPNAVGKKDSEGKGLFGITLQAKADWDGSVYNGKRGPGRLDWLKQYQGIDWRTNPEIAAKASAAMFKKTLDIADKEYRKWSGGKPMPEHMKNDPNTLYVIWGMGPGDGPRLLAAIERNPNETMEQLIDRKGLYKGRAAYTNHDINGALYKGRRIGDIPKLLGQNLRKHNISVGGLTVENGVFGNYSGPAAPSTPQATPSATPAPAQQTAPQAQAVQQTADGQGQAFQLDNVPTVQEMLKYIKLNSSDGIATLEGLTPLAKKRLFHLAKRWYEKSKGQKLEVNSGYRTRKKQEQLYEPWGKGKGIKSGVARPGTSKHQGGTAIDVQLYDKFKSLAEYDAFVEQSGLWREDPRTGKKSEKGVSERHHLALIEDAEYHSQIDDKLLKSDRANARLGMSSEGAMKYVRKTPIAVNPNITGRRRANTPRLDLQGRQGVPVVQTQQPQAQVQAQPQQGEYDKWKGMPQSKNVIHARERKWDGSAVTGKMYDTGKSIHGTGGIDSSVAFSRIGAWNGEQFTSDDFMKYADMSAARNSGLSLEGGKNNLAGWDKVGDLMRFRTGKMMKDYYELTGDKMSFMSGWRSYRRQANPSKSKGRATQGYSVHGYGHAIDFHNAGGGKGHAAFLLRNKWLQNPELYKKVQAAYGGKNVDETIDRMLNSYGLWRNLAKAYQHDGLARREDHHFELIMDEEAKRIINRDAIRANAGQSGTKSGSEFLSEYGKTVKAGKASGDHYYTKHQKQTQQATQGLLQSAETVQQTIEQTATASASQAQAAQQAIEQTAAVAAQQTQQTAQIIADAAMSTQVMYVQAGSVQIGGQMPTIVQPSESTPAMASATSTPQGLVESFSVGASPQTAVPDVSTSSESATPAPAGTSNRKVVDAGVPNKKALEVGRQAIKSAKTRNTKGDCAKGVKDAVAWAFGYKSRHAALGGGNAFDYFSNGLLEKKFGYKVLNITNYKDYVPMPGDIVVMGGKGVRGSSVKSKKFGHIQVYGTDGRWHSDHVQLGDYKNEFRYQQAQWKIFRIPPEKNPVVQEILEEEEAKQQNTQAQATPQPSETIEQPTGSPTSDGRGFVQYDSPIGPEPVSAIAAPAQEPAPQATPAPAQASAPENALEYEGGGESFVKLMARGEGNYNSYNRGTKSHKKALGYKQKYNFTGMTFNEVRAKQLKEFNAVGRYQVIESTWGGMEQQWKKQNPSWYNNGNALFNEENQDKMAAWMMDFKRPYIGKYIRGEVNDVTRAVLNASLEWASVANPKTGISSYKNNRATITVKQMAKALNTARANYARAIKAGYNKDDAMVFALTGKSYNKKQVPQESNKDIIKPAIPENRNESMGSLPGGTASPPVDTAMETLPGASPVDTAIPSTESPEMPAEQAQIEASQPQTTASGIGEMSIQANTVYVNGAVSGGGLGFFGGGLSNILNTITNPLRSIGGVISGAISAITNPIKSIGDTIGGFIGRGTSNITGLLSGITNNPLGMLQRGVSAIRNFFTAKKEDKKENPSSVIDTSKLGTKSGNKAYQLGDTLTDDNKTSIKIGDLQVVDKNATIDTSKLGTKSGNKAYQLGDTLTDDNKTSIKIGDLQVEENKRNIIPENEDKRKHERQTKNLSRKSIDFSKESKKVNTNQASQTIIDNKRTIVQSNQTINTTTQYYVESVHREIANGLCKMGFN